MDRATRGFALGGLAFVLLLRLVVPAGWMPASTGGFAVTLCTGSGPVTAWLDSDGRLHQSGKADTAPGKDAPCVFAAAGLSPLPALAAITMSHRTIVAALPSLASAVVAIGRGLAAPPPPATGPPATL